MSLVRTRGFATFDRNVIKTRWRRINETPAKRAGLLVRRIARNSIRKVKTKAPSPAGKPPRSRALGHPLRLIFSLPIQAGTGAIIGPVGFSARNPAPELLEFGGTKSLTDRQRLALVRQHNYLLKKGRDVRGRFLKRGAGQELEITNIRRVAVIRPRPFMGPSLRKAAPRIPTFWRGSLRGR